MAKILRRNFLFSLGAAALAGPVWANISGVKIGVCRPSRYLNDAVQFGFDYLEPAAAEIAEMDEPAFQAFKSAVLASSIRCESLNSFIRKLRVVGDDVHEAELQRYVESTLDRCRQLGASVVVWGSASSRNVESGYSRDRAWAQIQSFLRMAGGIAQSKGIVVAIEPLRHQESNILNTGAESLRMVRELNHPNVKMIIDYYHLREENEDPKIIWTARKEIVHFHFANPHGRLWPVQISEDSEYGEFFKLVKKIGFRGGISIEAHGTFEEDAKPSLAFFRRELSSSSSLGGG